MDIRLASALELPILESLAREIWPDTYADIISRDQMDFMLNWMYSTETLEKQQADGHEFYLIRKENRAIGFLAIAQIGDELKVNKVYVLPSAQGLGAGKKLMDKAIERAKAKDCTQLFLQVNRANKAKFFYEKLGFTIRKEEKFDIGNGYFMDDYVMELKLI
ncbi:MAG: GNAT family N-acetyltransferase [Flavobacteriales bacterium]